jgi:hypothetical protein
MANRTLRSCIVEIHTDDKDFTARECEGDCAVEQPTVLGCLEEPKSVDLPSQQEFELGSTGVGTECGLGQPDIGESRVTDTIQTPISDSGDLKNLFAGILAAINESNKALQSSVEAKLSNLQESVRADIRSENEKLINKFEGESKTKQRIFRETRFRIWEVDAFGRAGTKRY